MAKTPKSSNRKRQRQGGGRPPAPPRKPADGQTDENGTAKPAADSTTAKSAAGGKATGAQPKTNTKAGQGSAKTGQGGGKATQSKPERAIDRARSANKQRPQGKMVKGADRRREVDRKRRQRTWLYTGIAVAVIAALVAVIVLDGRQQEAEAQADTAAYEEAQAALAPARATAGCGEVQQQPNAGRNHINPNQQPSNWGQIPPTSGDHTIQQLQPGFYEEPQNLKLALHSLEHGYVEVHYKNIPDGQVQQLRDLQSEHGSDKFIVMNNPQLENDGVTLTAWQHAQTCEQVNLDVINGFIDAYMLPQGGQSVAPEPNAM